MRRFLMVAALAAGVPAIAGCSPKEEGAGEAAGTTGTGKPTVCVVNYPLAYFAGRIGGAAAAVQFPGPADVDPAYWLPDQAAITTYQQADLILLNGAGYAKWLDKVSLPDARVVNTSATLEDRFITIEESVTHTHGPDGEHAHGGLAFTTWLDPTMAVEQAKAVAAAFARTWPEQARAFEANRRALEKDLLDMDKQIEQVIARSPKTPLLFSHPVYQYFVRRYGINGESVHWEPDAAPTPAMWAELDKLVEEFPAKWMVWEGEPLAETAAALGKRGIRSFVFDPCGTKPEKGDYLTVMRANVAALTAAFSRG